MQCLQISDRGGGIPRSLTDRLFTYMYSTAPKPAASDVNTVPLAGTVKNSINPCSTFNCLRLTVVVLIQALEVLHYKYSTYLINLILSIF